MKISLFQGILLGAFGFAALVGIFVFATHTGSSSSGAQDAVGPVVIWGTLPKTEIQSALSTITQTDSTLKEVSYVQKNEATLPGDLATAIVTGAGPDLVLASQEDLLGLEKFLTPIPSATLPASTFESSFISGANLLATPDGSGYYGIPFLVDPLVLFYNKTILSSSGIAKPPATWEALTGLVPNIAQLTPTKQVMRGLIALGTYQNVHDARGILSTLFLQLGIPVSTYSNGALAADFSTKAAGDASSGQAALAFYTQFADPSKVSYTWNASFSDSQQSFLAGDLALYLGYVSEAKFLTEANPNLDFGVASVPQPATAKSKAVYGLMYSLMIPRGAKNASGAFQAAALLSSHDQQTAFSQTTGLAPASLTPLSSPPSDPTAAIAYAEALYTQGWLSPMPADTDTVFGTMIQDIITGRSDSLTALNSGKKSLGALLQK